MDTNSGEFVGLDRAQQWMTRVEVGQQLKILGEEFEVLEIGDRTMVVKLLSFEDRLGVPDLGDLIRDNEKRILESPESKEQARHRRKMLAGHG
jgi:hypothetical protein